MDFADIEKRALAALLSPKAADLKIEDLLSTSDTTVVNAGPVKSMTYDMLKEMMDDAEGDRQRMFEQEIEAFIVAGCKVVINELVPDGKLLILPKDYSKALERVLTRMKAAGPSTPNFRWGPPGVSYQESI